MPEYITRNTGYRVDQALAFAWGNNTDGALGDNTIIHRSSPVQITGGGTNWKQVEIIQIFPGPSRGYGLKTDGTLWGWGSNDYGQLGFNTNGGKFSSPIQIGNSNSWFSLATVDQAAFNHMAAIKTDGTLWQWGLNYFGVLADGTQVHRSSPVQTIAGGNNWKFVAVGSYSTAAIKTDGTLWLWGFNGYGQLGDNTQTLSYSSPIQTVAGGTNWKQVTIDERGAAAIKTDGTLWTWGNNIFGELGTNNVIHRSSPVQTISGGTNWTHVSKGNRISRGVKSDGTLWVWGRNSQGALGDNTIIHRSSPVQTVAGGNNWTKAGPIVKFSEDSYGLKADGTLWVWGVDEAQQGSLGDNTQVHRSSPVQTIAGGTNWIDLRLRSPGTEFLGHQGLVTKEYMLETYPTLSQQFKNAGLHVWGRSDFGNLGDGTTTNKSSMVQTLAGGTNWLQYSGWVANSGAVKTDGTLWVWGLNASGQIGDNTTTGRSSPVQTVSGGTNWKQFSVGNSFSGAIKTDGTLWMWGDGTAGQLGDGTRANRSSPIQTISTGTDWKQIALGASMTGAVKTDGTLWLWGQNHLGQLGDGTITNRSSPVQTISGGNNWKNLVMGVYHGGAVKTDGTLWMWGENHNAQLGDNTLIHRSSPVQTIAGGTNWKQLAFGYFSTVAVKTDGTLWTWGQNDVGQLGDGTKIHRSSPVQTIAGGSNWYSVAGRLSQTFAIKTDGTLWRWGDNNDFGAGDNTSTYIQRSSPTQLTSHTNWKKLWDGIPYALGIIRDDSEDPL